MHESNEDFYEEVLAYLEERIFVLQSEHAITIKKILNRSGTRNIVYRDNLIDWLDTSEGIDAIKKINAFYRTIGTEYIPFVARSCLIEYLMNFIED